MSAGERAVGIRVDLKLPPQHVAWPVLRDASLEADRADAFTSLWFFDHLHSVSSGPNPSPEPGPCFEGWSILAGLATVTDKIRLGLMVSAVPYRHPGVLANIVATIDVMSGGRVDLGLGAGNNLEEVTAYGINMGPPGERIAALDEACTVLRALLGPDDVVSFAGAHFSLEGARCLPKPVQTRVPFFIGGKGERKTLPLVARHGDGWNYSNGTPEEFAAKLAVLRASCEAFGREPGAVMPSVQVRALPGELHTVAANAQGYIAAGARHIILYTPADPASVEPLARIADELRAHGAAL
ncbi:MAG: LLM class flavin-dependent oxidoreductase [Acidimicrobiales bacterium]